MAIIKIPVPVINQDFIRQLDPFLYHVLIHHVAELPYDPIGRLDLHNYDAERGGPLRYFHPCKDRHCLRIIDWLNSVRGGMYIPQHMHMPSERTCTIEYLRALQTMYLTGTLKYQHLSRIANIFIPA